MLPSKYRKTCSKSVLEILQLCKPYLAGTLKCFKALSGLLKTIQTWLIKVFTWVRWSSKVYRWPHPSWGPTVRQEVDHCWGVVSGVTPRGVQLPLAVSHGLHLLITRLRTDASAAAEIFPMGSCHRAPVVVCHRTGLIGVRVFTVHAVCTDRVTGQPGYDNMEIRQNRSIWKFIMSCFLTHLVGFDDAGSFSDAYGGTQIQSPCPGLAGLLYLPDTYQLQ